MKCLCDEGETTYVKIEGDMGADPIWCDFCMCNLDLEDFLLSDALADELWDWMREYGEWMNWDKDQFLPNGIELEEIHNLQGKALTEKVKKELEGKYSVRFSPSTMVSTYSIRK